MDPWTIWLTIAIILLILEVCTQMMWALCLALGGLVALVFSLFDTGLEWQVIAMVAGALICYALLLPRYRRRQMQLSARTARTGMDALLGRRAVVTHEIKPGKLGRARIDGDNWQVQAPGVDHVIPAGTEVSVTAYDSIILTVELI